MPWFWGALYLPWIGQWPFLPGLRHVARSISVARFAAGARKKETEKSGQWLWMENIPREAMLLGIQEYSSETGPRCGPGSRVVRRGSGGYIFFVEARSARGRGHGARGADHRDRITERQVPRLPAPRPAAGMDGATQQPAGLRAAAEPCRDFIPPGRGDRGGIVGGEDAVGCSLDHR